MNSSQGIPGPAGAFPVPPMSAVNRLRDVREHQGSFAQELAHNWKGWFGSFFLHATLLMLFVLLAAGVVAPMPREHIIETDPLEALDPLTHERIEDLLPDQVVDTTIDKMPSLPTFADQPNPSVKGPELAGTDLGIALGPLPFIFGPGGPGGDDWAGRRIRGTLGGDDWANGLDIVFVFDSTGSMGGIILEVKSRIRQFMTAITYFVPNTRLGFVTYRDKQKYDLDDYHYTVKYLALTSPKDGMDKIQRFLNETEAFGGGDIPEAVFDGVKTAINSMQWRDKAKKIIIVFGDAPPRPEDNGLSQLVDLIRGWHDRSGGIVSAIDTTGSSKLMEEFKAMSEAGGGRAAHLNNEEAIVRQLMITVFPENVSKDVGDWWDRFKRQQDKNRDVVEERK